MNMTERALMLLVAIVGGVLVCSAFDLSFWILLGWLIFAFLAIFGWLAVIPEVQGKLHLRRIEKRYKGTVRATFVSDGVLITDRTSGSTVMVLKRGRSS